MDNFVVRRVKPSDWKDIYELNCKVGYVYDEEKVQGRIQNLLDSGIDIIMVAELDSKVIGYIHGTPYNTLYSDNLVSIIQLVFNVEHRKDKELTCALVEKFEVVAKKNGYYGIRMAADANRSALYDLMISTGFENTRDLKHYIKYLDK